MLRSDRPGPTRPRRRSRRARRTAVLLAGLALLASAASGCVGKRGRNDDVVAPGSEGRPRLEVPTRIDGSPPGPAR